MSNDDQVLSKPFKSALRRVLRPMVRVLISRGLAAPAFYRLVKETYVEVAQDMLRDKASDSRISVMTGVHRRDVKEIRSDEGDGQANVRRQASMLATVVGRWLSDETLTQNGKPLPLSRAAFDALVQSISRDVRPRAVLDEIVRQKLAVVEGDIITLSEAALIGPADLEQRLHFFAQNVGDHMNAAVENVTGEAPSMLERAVFYNHLTATSVDAIEAKARAISQDALLAVNKTAAELQTQDADDRTATQRFRYGVFFYREDEMDAQEGSDANDP